MKMMLSTPFSWPCRLLLPLLLLQSSWLPLNNNSNSNGVHHVGVAAQEGPNPRLQAQPFAADAPSFRQDFCTRSANLNNETMMAEIDIGSLLQGVVLNTAIELGEFLKFDQHGGDDIRHNVTLNADYPGLIPRLMDEICRRAGCTWRNTYTILGELPANRSYSDLLAWSTDTYDISLDWWMRSTERMLNGVTFTEPWYDASIIMVTKNQEHARQKERFNPVSWLAPFDNYVWLMIVVTIFVSALIYWTLEVLNPATDQCKYQLDPVETLWLLAIAFAGRFEFDPQTSPARLFTFSISFWANLMGAAYTANLASFLVVKNKSQMDIESIEQAIRMNIPMCVYESTLTHQAIEQRFPTYAQSGLLIPTTLREAYEGIGSKCNIVRTEVSTWKGFQVDETINGDCSLYWTGRAFDFVPASFGVQADSGHKCTSLVKTVFDVHLHDIIKEGKLEEMWDEHLQATATVFCPTGGGSGGSRRLVKENDYDDVVHARPTRADATGNGRSRLLATEQSTGLGGDDQFSDTTQLTLHNMGGVFVLHGILSGLAILSALVSWSRKRHANSASAAARNKESAGAAGGNGKSIEHDVVSSTEEFLDASASAPESRQKMVPTNPMENGNETAMNAGTNHIDDNSDSDAAAVDDLLSEVKQQLNGIHQRLRLYSTRRNNSEYYEQGETSSLSVTTRDIE